MRPNAASRASAKPDAPRVITAVRRPRWPRIAGVIVVCVATIVLLAYATRVAIDLYGASLTLTRLSADPSPVAVTIGGENVAVPRNMLRGGDSVRNGQTVDRAELLLRWPGLEGYAPASAADFTDGSPFAPLVYATISPRTVALDSAARLDNIYARYFVGAPIVAPGGLTARALSAESGYTGEVVYYGPAGQQRFVARCLARATADMPATCIRDLPMGQNLTLLYRFNRDIIGDWQALDAGMQALAARLVPPQ